MKTLFFAIILLLFALIAWTQAPQTINYQAVARDSTGTPLANQHLNVRLSIYNGSAAGSLLYQETDTVTTSGLGLFTINISSSTATVVSGTFSSIDWADSSKYLAVAVDPAGGSSFIDMGTSQLLSVPYALYSGASSKTSGTPGGIAYYGSTGIGTTDPYFYRNDTDYTTNLMRVKNHIQEGVLLGQLSGFDGAYFMRIDTAANHIDIIGEFYGRPWPGGPDTIHQIGILCQDNTTGAGAAVLLIDSDPTSPKLFIEAGNGGNWAGASLFTFDTVFTGVINNSTGAQTGLLSDTNYLHLLSNGTSWNWPTADGAANEVLSTNGSGTLGWSNPSSTIPTAHWCSLYDTSTQSIPDVTWTTINFNKHNYDTDAFHSDAMNNTRITIPTGLGGVYTVRADIAFNSGEENFNIGVKFLVNGSTDTYGFEYDAKSFDDNTAKSYTATMHLNAGDYVEAEVFQNSGYSLSTANSHQTPLFTAILVGQ